MEDKAVIVTHLNKQFRIYHERRDSFKQVFLSGFRKIKSDNFQALTDISLSINKGEFFGIVGRNGSGKSTLLKVIAGIYTPSSGSVTVNGRITPFLELGVGFNPELTARENIYLNGVILGLSRKEIEEKFESIVDFAEIREFIDTQLKKFSSGMQVRLAFAVAINAHADILIIDEILAVGDSAFQQKCFDIFERYKKEGKTIIFVTHDTSAIRRFCDRAAYIKAGKLMMVGSTDEVIDKYIYEDRTAVEEKQDEKIEEPQEKITGKKKDSSKKFHMTKVTLKDKSGKENNTFVSGDDIHVVIEYDNKQKLPSAVFGIAIFNLRDEIIFGTNSLVETKEEIQLQEHGTLTITLRNIPLNNGSFLITLAAHNRSGENYEWLDKKFQFNIMRATQTDGILRIGTEWH